MVRVWKLSESSPFKPEAIPPIPPEAEIVVLARSRSESVIVMAPDEPAYKLTLPTDEVMFPKDDSVTVMEPVLPP